MVISLKAISPLDGRYSDKLKLVRYYCSEFSFFKIRIAIEIKWLKRLSYSEDIKELKKFNQEEEKYLNYIIKNLSVKDIQEIKKIELKINHDMKAVEYFIKKKFALHPKLKKIKEFVHFACTSEDINNLSYAIMIRNIRSKIIIPYWNRMINVMKVMAHNYKFLPLLSRTHGQPASTSTLGKEIVNFVFRMKRQLVQLKNLQILGKINGTVGNYNAHAIAYPKIDWVNISKNFVHSLGIHWNPYTTQIEPHDYIVEFLNCITRFNNIMINFNIDMWHYISLDYFNLKFIKSEVGSSIMPHKVNPINFENSEANLGISNSIMNHLSSKLQISRWQRDLTDSTILRNLGSCIGYSVVAYQNLLDGIKRVRVNKKCLLSKLNEHWEILSEPIQIIMRKNNISNSYEKLKFFSMGKNLSAHKIRSFIKNLSIPNCDKKSLIQLTPRNYVGYATKMVDKFLSEN